VSEPSRDLETWLPVVGYEGYYEVSDLGRARSLDRAVVDKKGVIQRRRGCPLRPSVNPKSGHCALHLRKYGSTTTVSLHRLVLTMFSGPAPEGMECCHENGNPSDNRLVNLRWDTRLENLRDRIRHGQLHHNSLKPTCVNGHRLHEPNLKRSEVARGHRKCLACTRAHGVCWRAARNGRKLDFRLIADQKYVEIMGAVVQ